MKENIILSVDFEGADATTKKSITLGKTVKKLGDEKRSLASQIKKLDTTSKTYQKDLGALIGRQNQVNAQLKISKKEFANNERVVIGNTTANRALDGSIEQMRIQLSLAQREYVKMSAAQRTGTQRGKELQQNIQHLDSAVKGNEESIGVHNRSVGNYGKSMGALTPLMGSFGAQISMVQGVFTQLQAAFVEMKVVQEANAVATQANTLANQANTAATAANTVSTDGSIVATEANTVATGTNSTVTEANTTALTATSVAQKGVAIATKGTNIALKLFRIALISTGIGAIVVALGAMLAALLSTQKGMDAMNRVLTPMKEIFGELFGILQDIGVPVWEAYLNILQIYLNVWKVGYLSIVSGITQLRIAWNDFTGDSVKADKLRKELKETDKKLKETKQEIADLAEDTAKQFKKMGDIAGETGDRMEKALKRGSQLADLEEEISRLEQTQKLREATIQLEIESQRRIRKDKSLGDAERRKAEAAEIEATRQLRQIEIDLINKKREQLELEAEANDTSREDSKEINDMKAEALQKEAVLQKDITRISQEGNSERKVEAANALKAIETEKAKKIETEKELLDQKIQLLELDRRLTIANSKETDEERYNNEVKLQEEIQALKLQSSKLSNEDTLIMQKEHIVSMAELKQKEIDRVNDVIAKDKEAKKAQEEKEAAEKEKEDAIKDKKEEDKRKAYIALGIDSAKTIADGVLKNQARRLNEGTKREIEALNLRKQAGTISEEEFAKAREDIDRKAFKKKKALDTKQVIINGLVGSAKTIANLGLPAALPALIGVGVQTATQVAGIQSQSFAEGGWTGSSNQPRDHTGERPVGTVHEKEFVASRRTLATPRGLQMASQLNSINKNPSLGYFADGGFTSSVNVSTEGIERSISKALTNMRVINVATDTSKVDSRVKKIQNKGRI